MFFRQMARGISSRAQGVVESATVAVSAKARTMMRHGVPVIDLGIGEPDLPPPMLLTDGVAAFAKKPHKIYSDVAGTPETLEGIVATLKRDYGFTYTPKQVMGFDGGKVGLDRLFEVMLDPEDEVIIPVPGWLSYGPQVKLSGGRPVFVDATISNRFKITAEQLAAAITEKTKAFVLCSLNNPTGIAYTEQELNAFAAVLLRHPQIRVISDDLYQHMDFKGQFRSIGQVCPALFDRLITVNGTTKSHSWRFGYVATPDEELIKAMCRIQSHRSGHPNLEAQAGARIAFEMGPISSRAAIFKDRHDRLLPLLQKMPGWRVVPSDGAFYFFVDVRDSMLALGIHSDVEYATAILEKAEVAMVPGSAFGSGGHLRIAYSQPIEKLTEAMQRVHDKVAVNATPGNRLAR